MRWLWRDVVLPFFLSRLTLATVGVLAVHFGEMRPEHPHASPHVLIDIWARWDSFNYWHIAANGYDAMPREHSLLAFFPLYPLLLRLLTGGQGAAAMSTIMVVGWLLSNAFALVACALLYDLVANDWGASIARRTLWLLLLFPTSFYLSVVYTESLFLLLVVGAFVCARRDAWVAAGALGALAAATRPVGAFLMIPLLAEWYRQPARRWTSLVPLALVPLGLLAFMAYLDYAFGDPLMFLHVQAQWGRATSVTGLIGRLEYIVRFLQATPLPETLTRFGLDLIFTVLAAWMLIALPWRRQPGYALYCVGIVGIPMATLNPMSMPRFFIVAFPFFIVLAQWLRRPAWFYAVLVACAVLQAVLFARWSLCYWVA